MPMGVCWWKITGPSNRPLGTFLRTYTNFSTQSAKCSKYSLGVGLEIYAEKAPRQGRQTVQQHEGLRVVLVSQKTSSVKAEVEEFYIDFCCSENNRDLTVSVPAALPCLGRAENQSLVPGSAISQILSRGSKKYLLALTSKGRFGTSSHPPDCSWIQALG